MQKTDLALRSATNNFRSLPSTSITERLSHITAVRRLSALYSELLDMQVTPVQAVYYIYAVICGVCALVPFTIELGWRALAFTLFYISVRRAFRKA